MGRFTRHGLWLMFMIFGLIAGAVWLPLAGCGPSGNGGAGESQPEVSMADNKPDDKPGGMEAFPLSNVLAGEEATLFTQLDPAQTGVDLVNTLETEHPGAFLYASGFACGGVSIGDVNGDGRPDLFFTRGAKGNALYLQRDSMRFEDVSEWAGIAGDDSDWASGSTLADVDNDGDLDIYVCNYNNSNQLFLNPGVEGEPFVEVAAEWGLDLLDASVMPSFADFDNDGDLDVFVLTNRNINPNGRPASGVRADTGLDGVNRILPPYDRYYGYVRNEHNQMVVGVVARADYLLRNDGGKFTDVTASAGLAGNIGHGLSATWWDYNGDGRLDLHVSNDYIDPDRLYRNNGDGTFTNVIGEALAMTSWFSMGADAGDLNGDGRLDLMTADMANTTHYKSKVSMGEMGGLQQWVLENVWPRATMRNTVFINSGSGYFVEQGYLTGLAKSDWTWAVKIADFDNDGLNDVFLTNGQAREMTHADRAITDDMRIGRTEWDIAKDWPPLMEENVAFRNEGGMHFVKVAHDWGLDHYGMSFAAATGDLDGDGDLDLVVTNLDEPAFIYRNNSRDGHRLVVELVGTRSNLRGIGALVRVTTAQGVQVRQMVPATGFLSTNDHKLHFGLGEQSVIERLEVCWPSGEKQVFENIDADQRLVITEPASGAKPGPIDPPPTPILAVRPSEETGLRFSHIESGYYDFTNQPLLPGRLSRMGGGVAVGDADGDGHDDIYFCNAGGQAGALMLWRDGGYIRADGPWRRHSVREDMAALFFDADGDGDADLLVTSGSNEYERGSENQFDRLYLNDGAAGFTHAPNALPAVGEASGVVAAADFDLDGDLDLFIGARCVPDAYPTTPDSRLLRNDGGVFTDVTDSFAPGLREAGMVTGAAWADIDADGKPDLLLSLDWGPIKCFQNTGDGLVDCTAQAGLDKRVGWFNSVTPVDLDGDGDLDLVALNDGLNTKYGQLSPEKVAHLFYGDFDGNGIRNLVEAKPGTADELLPVRGFS